MKAVFLKSIFIISMFIAMASHAALEILSEQNSVQTALANVNPYTGIISKCLDLEGKFLEKLPQGMVTLLAYKTLGEIPAQVYELTDDMCADIHKATDIIGSLSNEEKRAKANKLIENLATHCNAFLIRHTITKSGGIVAVYPGNNPNILEKDFYFNPTSPAVHVAALHYSHRPKSSSIHIDNIYTNSLWQKKGHAKALACDATEFMKDHYDAKYLTVVCRNEFSEKIFEKCGFWSMKNNELHISKELTNSGTHYFNTSASALWGNDLMNAFHEYCKSSGYKKPVKGNLHEQLEATSYHKWLAENRRKVLNWQYHPL